MIPGQTFDYVLRADAPLAHCSEEARPYTARYSSFNIFTPAISTAVVLRHFSTTRDRCSCMLGQRWCVATNGVQELTGASLVYELGTTRIVPMLTYRYEVRTTRARSLLTAVESDVTAS